MITAVNSLTRWRAPRGDGDILIWPDPDVLVHQASSNHSRLSAAEATVQNMPARELRRYARQSVGHPDHARPLIVTGHQVELVHPGVWAKNVLIGVLADRVGGVAAHLAVDTDAPKHLELRFPGVSLPITDDPAIATAPWAGQLHLPTGTYLDRIVALFAEAAAHWPFSSLFPSLLNGLRDGAPQAGNLTTPLMNAIHQLDLSLGLNHNVFLASDIWESPAYLAFVHHVLARAESFAHAYNAALDDFRRVRGIRNTGRPWPKLHAERDRCEVPFWLDELDQPSRQRARIERDRDEWALRLPGGDCFVLNPAVDAIRAADAFGRFLAQRRYRLAPRAMTLTAFVRLFLADHFVHGIGGGQYDAVTDRIIADWLGVEPPEFAVTTATLFFPTATLEAPVDLEALHVEGRRLRHGWSDCRKRELVRAIEAATRKSRERQLLFLEMHRRLTQGITEAAYGDWMKRMECAQELAARQRDIYDRELFYAIQPSDRLQGMIDRYRARF